MKTTLDKSSTLFLQAVIVLLGIGALALLLWEPHLEGRNVNATLFQIYFNDPFLLLVYTGSIPFFVALYQAFQLLGYAGRNQLFSKAAVNAVRSIKYSALIIIGFVALEEIIILLNRGNDDAAGAVVLGMLIAFGSFVVATVAAVLEQTLRNALHLKSENDLTV